MTINFTKSFPLIVLLLILFFGASNLFSAPKIEYQLSTHVLDISKGLPAENVEISLYKLDDKSNTWLLLSTLLTDKNGRISDFLPKNVDNKGTYKLQFQTKKYFDPQGIESIYPYIDVNFVISGKSHYHIPITLSPYGYSTYRGS
jgi:5-hydroxyisourate hydrolase